MNYKIVQNEQALREFIDWLPELEPDEIYYLALFARKKYSPELRHSKTDKTQLKRFTSDKTKLFDKIKQLECAVGSYRLKGVEAPQESLALYITVNPRSQTLAARGSLKKLADLVSNPYQGWNVHQEILSQIQKAKSRTCWVDFDIDLNSSDGSGEAVFLNKFLEFKQVLIPEDPWTYNSNIKLLKTHSGYHILINPVYKFSCKFWYKLIIQTFSVDQTGDNMIPVVGCSQGGFVPKFII